jgi:hypothetical protein
MHLRFFQFVMFFLLASCATTPEPVRDSKQIESAMLHGYQIKLTDACKINVVKSDQTIFSKTLEHKGLCFFAKTKKGKPRTYVHLPQSDTGLMVLVHSSQKKSPKQNDTCEGQIVGVMIDNGTLQIQTPPLTELQTCSNQKSTFDHKDFSTAWFAIKAGRNTSHLLITK